MKNSKLFQNETIPSLQYCKLLRDSDENAKEWMTYLKINANEGNYQECDR